MNYEIKIDLMKLRNTVVTDSKTKGKGVFIPIEDNDIFVSDKGAAYLTITAFENREQRFGKTHSLKQKISRQLWKSLPDEEKRMPYIGNMSEDTSIKQPTENGQQQRQSYQHAGRPQQQSGGYNSSSSTSNLPF